MHRILVFLKEKGTNMPENCENTLVYAMASSKKESMFVNSPLDPIIRAWLAEYSDKFTDDDLKTWLAACPR
jgi:hypothetical protein